MEKCDPSTDHCSMPSPWSSPSSSPATRTFQPLLGQLSPVPLTSRLDVVADSASESRAFPSHVLPVASLHWGTDAAPSNGEVDWPDPILVRVSSIAATSDFGTFSKSPAPSGLDTFRSYQESSAGRTRFSLQGELMHAFICYRVATEGDMGHGLDARTESAGNSRAKSNGLSARIYARIRELSLDSEQKALQIPRHGWGTWMKSAQKPHPFVPAQAKVFLDRECLLDGQNWVTGFVRGLAASMCFVPLLSWTKDDTGSVGELSRIGVAGFDKEDNVLLELIIATALCDEPGGVLAILPVLLGQARPAAKGGGFSAFPFYKVARLSDLPSRATNARAGVVLRQLGVSEEKVQGVLDLSVKQVVELVLRYQGVQASQCGDMEGVATTCATRVLKTVLNEVRRLRSDPQYFENGTPCGSEVLEWLQAKNLKSFAPLLIHHNLDSLENVARLKPEEVIQLCDEHDELYPRCGGKGQLGGHFKKLELAHSKLLEKTPASCMGLFPARRDERARPISERLERFSDEEASPSAFLTCGNGLELAATKRVPMLAWVLAWTLFSLGFSTAAPWLLDREAWGVRAGMLLTQAVCAFVAGLLAIFCPTARFFVDTLVLYLPFYWLQGSAASAIEWVETGNSFLFWYWTPINLGMVAVLWFRRRYFPQVYLTSVFFGYCGRVPLGCVAYASIDDGKYATYSACVVQGFQGVAHILASMGFIAVLLLGRQLFNHVSARQAAKTSREHHRALWRRELSKVEASPEVMESLRRLTDGIRRELNEQRRFALSSLGLFARGMAMLHRRVGRWSLRGSRSKARQAHGDIDLLFDEAAQVNEPFQDLMASLMGGSTDGEAERSGVWTPGFSEVDQSEAGASASPMAPMAPSPGLELERGPIKKPERALQKLVRLYGRDVAMLTDLVRCMVVAQDLRQVGALLVSLDSLSVVGLAGVAPKERQMTSEEMLEINGSNFSGVDERIMRITAISNRFDDSYDDTTSGGYRGSSLSVEVGWTLREGLVSFERVRDWEALNCQRHICEIQVHLASQHHQIHHAGLHSRYVELRNQYNS